MRLSVLFFFYSAVFTQISIESRCNFMVLFPRFLTLRSVSSIGVKSLRVEQRNEGQRKGTC